MNVNRRGRITVDFIMTALLPCLMAYTLIGETVHEWLGLTMFLLWITHHILNVKWYKNLNKGRYTVVRVMDTVINGLLVLVMISMMISGIMLSKHVFSFLPLDGGADFARTLHLLGAYWGFVLMSLHLGFHWNMVMAGIEKLIPAEQSSPLCVLCVRAAAAIFSLYGILAFVRRQLASYLFLQNQFVFFDFSESIIAFLADYLSILVLFACAGYYGRRLLRLTSSLSLQRSGFC